MTQPEARCLCGTPACDHVRLTVWLREEPGIRYPLRYIVRAWLQHRLVFGFGILRGHLR